MGLEGGSAVANSVPDCLSFVQGPGTVLGNLSWKSGRPATANLGRGMPREGSYRRFFGRDVFEPAACKGRLDKGRTGMKKCRESFNNGTKMLPYWTLEVPRSLPEVTLKKVPPLLLESSTFLEPFLEPGVDFWGIDFCMFFGYPPRTTFYDFGAQKVSKMEAFGGEFGDFSENAKTSIFDTPHQV